MLNVRFVCWFMNIFVVSTWLQHRVLLPDKQECVLEGILKFLTLQFSIRVLPIISFRFLFLLKTVIGCSWNNSCRFLLVWRMFQFLQTTAVRFDKNWLHVNINGMRFGSCCSFSCSRSSLTSLSIFSNCSSASFWLQHWFKNLFFSSLEWWSKPFLVGQILFIRSAWLYWMPFLTILDALTRG